MIYVLFNPKSNNSHGEDDARKWAECLSSTPEFVSLIGLDYKKFFDGLTEDDEAILCGGDGTINYFANEMYGYEYKCMLSYVKCGTGNDFYRDIAQYEKDGKIDLRPFLKNLPLVKVNGIEKRFINGIGYGIDGDTCLIGDEIREKDPGVEIDYSKIAINLLLHDFNVKNATVIVDGDEKTYSNVWLSSTMFGKFYGGGMMAAPNQNRLNEEHTCTVTTFSSKGRLTTLLRFPTFSKGKHKGKKFLESRVGHHFKVMFDEPCALQIDGDTVKDVKEYEVIID